MWVDIGPIERECSIFGVLRYAVQHKMTYLELLVSYFLKLIFNPRQSLM